MTDKSTRTGQSRNFGERNGLRPSSKTVYNSEQISESLRWRKWPDQIDMNVIELTAWQFKLRQWSLDVLMNLRCLARNTGSGPGADILANSRPNKLGSDESSGSTNRWVNKAMNGVENLTAAGARHERARTTSRNVAEKGLARVTKRHWQEMQTG